MLLLPRRLMAGLLTLAVVIVVYMALSKMSGGEVQSIAELGVEGNLTITGLVEVTVELPNGTVLRFNSTQVITNEFLSMVVPRVIGTCAVQCITSVSGVRSTSCPDWRWPDRLVVMVDVSAQTEAPEEVTIGNIGKVVEAKATYFIASVDDVANIYRVTIGGSVAVPAGATIYGVALGTRSPYSGRSYVIDYMRVSELQCSDTCVVTANFTFVFTGFTDVAKAIIEYGLLGVWYGYRPFPVGTSSSEFVVSSAPRLYLLSGGDYGATLNTVKVEWSLEGDCAVGRYYFSYIGRHVSGDRVCLAVKYRGAYGSFWPGCDYSYHAMVGCVQRSFYGTAFNGVFVVRVCRSSVSG